jgi:hypothetical protein
MIGLIIFLSIGNIFKIHSESVRGDLVNYSLKLTNSLISSAAIASAVSCKQCDTVSVNFNTEESIAGYFAEIKLANGLNVSTTEKSSFSSIHKMNETITSMSGTAFSVKPITLTFERTKNKLMIK